MNSQPSTREACALPIHPLHPVQIFEGGDNWANTRGNTSQILNIVLLGRSIQLDTRHLICSWMSNGTRQELKIQMALRVKSVLFSIQWQCRFKT